MLNSQPYYEKKMSKNVIMRCLLAKMTLILDANEKIFHLQYQKPKYQKKKISLKPGHAIFIKNTLMQQRSLKIADLHPLLGHRYR